MMCVIPTVQNSLHGHMLEQVMKIGWLFAN